ncbi:MAG: histidine--tRNA ligase [Lachnospirales bacterium]
MAKAPKGTYDLYDDQMEIFQYIYKNIEEIANTYSLNKIKTPTFESTELFQRGVGDTTDIVQKEMYTFQDKGNRSMTLKPEGTAGVVRAFLERKIYANPQPTKFYYTINCFRYEQPQSGRFREFSQFGIEYFGTDSPLADVEVISVANDLLNKLGITNLTLKINSLGDKECRNKYNNEMKNFISLKKDQLCPTCQDRYEKNPLRVLDCKNPDCQNILKNAPQVIDVLGEECKSHFEKVLKGLDILGINYEIDSRLVRGLDYYTKTVFEFISNDIGAQGTICGGGRYNNLVEECGGPATPAIGLAIGIERLALVLKNLNLDTFERKKTDIYIGSLDTDFQVIELAKTLRDGGISVVTDIIGRSLKAQMKYADKLNSKFSTIVGSEEIKNKELVIKNMETGEKETVSFNNILEFFGRK